MSMTAAFTTPVERALHLAELGYYVHPLKRGDKAPRTKNGHLDSTRDPAIIAKFWSANSGDNIGIDLQSSGVLVIGPDCHERLAEFEQLGLPDTMKVQTGSGPGHIHHFYHVTPDCPIHRLCISGDFDILTNGYVVAPGSFTTGAYLPLTPIRNVEDLPEAPAWAVQMLADAVAKEAAKPAPVALPSAPLSFSDQDIIERCSRSKNGAAFDRLFAGDISAHGGVDRSHSGAELALLSRLTFYTQDEGQIERLYLSSGLARPENWRGSYRTATLKKALSRAAFYEPSTARVQTPTIIIPNGNGVHHENGTGDIPPMEPPVETVDNVNGFPPVLPRVDAGDLHLSRVTTAALDAILDANDPPFLFRQGGQPIRIETGDNDEPIMRTLTEDRLRHVLARLIGWYKIVRTKQGFDELPALPPIHVVKDILATPNLPLPRLDMVTEAPTFAPDGTLDTRPGYHRATRTYYAPAAGFAVPDVPIHPTAVDIAKAHALIVDELLGDFPFISDAERANAVALLLLPFVRPLIHGPVPLHLFEKPQVGTGASLLVEVITSVATGRSPAVMTAGRDEDEWRKRITSSLRAGVQHIQIDNIRERLDSASLAAAITATSWTDRLLGGNETITLPVRCIWIATGNNPALSSEITRRTVRIRLDAKQDRPWERTEFRHANLRLWALENRSELVWASLTLIRAWFAAGQPSAPSAPSLGSFEAWARILGGVLNTSGIVGFLDNLKEFYDESDTEGTEIRGFLQAWMDKHGTETVTVSTLFEIATRPDSALDLKAKSEQGQKVRLGRMLAELRDRHYRLDNVTVAIKHDGTYKRAALWCLVTSNSGESAPRDSPGGNPHTDAENQHILTSPGESGESDIPCPYEKNNQTTLIYTALGEKDSPDSPDSPTMEDDDVPF